MVEQLLYAKPGTKHIYARERRNTVGPMSKPIAD
jgi:hypothetical protein